MNTSLFKQLHFCGILFASALLLFSLPASAQDAESPSPSREEVLPLPLDEVRMFTEVLNSIRSAYIEPLDDRTLLENAIKGMLAGIDPHSSYLADEAYEALQESTSGEFGGLGVEVGISDGYITIISPIEGSPADRAGVQAGDMIIKIDDTPTTDVTLGDTVNLMRGAPGTDITLTIIRSGVPDPFEITFTREIIASRSVRSRSLEPGYGYIRITQFAVNTGDEVIAAIESLQRDNEDLRGIILDLRNNPGGVLQASVKVADAFIDEGLIVYTKGRAPNSDISFEATPGDISRGVPLIVLINGGSASASEVVAGALQDHNRAIVMGTRSFGKGSVQTVLPLTNNRAIKLTTSLYYTPNGRSIQARGIVPNITVDHGQVRRAPVNISAYRESDLSNHLQNTTDELVDQNASIITPTYDVSAEEVLVSDYQLNEALNVLKGLSVYRRQTRMN